MNILIGENGIVLANCTHYFEGHVPENGTICGRDPSVTPTESPTVSPSLRPTSSFLVKFKMFLDPDPPKLPVNYRHDIFLPSITLQPIDRHLKKKPEDLLIFLGDIFIQKF